MLFSEQVLFVRKELKLSQEKLAKELDVSFATINRWENGIVFPSFKTQEKFVMFCKEKGINFEK